MSLNTISISLSIILTGIGIIKAIVVPINKILKLQEAQTDGIRCLLRRDILEIINRVEERGYIYRDEAEQLRKLYINYKNLKGNGIVDKMIDSAFLLPIKRRESKNEKEKKL